MKRLLFIMLLSVIGADAKAAFFEDGKIWDYDVTVFRNQASDSYGYIMLDTVDGDTVVENRACKKIRHTEYYLPDGARLTSQTQDDVEWWTCESPDNAWWTYEYEDSGRVYRYYDNDAPGFRKIMDFNLQIGDSVKSYELYGADFVVDWVGYMSFKNISRKTISLKIESGLYWIEDIGSSVDENIDEFTKNNDVWRQLYRCYQDGKCIYYGGEYEFETEIKSAVIDAGEESALYDMMGRRVEHPQRGSLYIRGGKKLIWQD